MYSLTLKLERVHTPQEILPRKDTTSERRSSPAPEDGSPSKATSCNLCRLGFSTLQEQRQHVKSDLHNYNLKQKMRGAKPVTEADFERQIGELNESISGSDTSDSESEEDNEREGTLTTLLKKQARISGQGLEDDPTLKPRKGGSGKPPLLWFSSSSLPLNTSLGIYRAIFSREEQEEPSHIMDSIRRKQLSPIPDARTASQNLNGGVNLATRSPHYFLCMIGGGHFAGMIVSLIPKVSKKSGALERQATVLAHKTFHRYTTRRKQGGSQSANDSAKGNAHSAGSSLRRYNEAALTAEVRALLAEWKTMIDTAELLFIRATGNTNRQTLFGPYEGQVLRQNDSRVRGFPFSTRRATQSELMRAFVELTRVKVSQIDEAALAAAAAAKEAEKEEKPRTSTPKLDKSSKLSEEEETTLLHTTQLQSLIRRSKAPALLSYIQSNSISPDFRFFPECANYHAPTVLHLAASSSSPALISSLLLKAKADPTIRSSEGKTAFDLAGDRATRDAFRLARHQLGESAWPWDQTDIPSALSPADAEARDKQEKAEKAAEDSKEAERRRQATERLRKEDQDRADERREKKHGVGKTLNGLEKTGAEKRDEEARGMTPEMRARLERERRARAAEERIRRMQQGG